MLHYTSSSLDVIINMQNDAPLKYQIFVDLTTQQFMEYIKLASPRTSRTAKCHLHINEVV